MEVAIVLRDDIDRGIVFDVRLLEFLLLFSERKDTEFGHIVAEAVCGLRVLGHGDHFKKVSVLVLPN